MRVSTRTVGAAVLCALPAVAWAAYTWSYWRELNELLRVGALNLTSLVAGSFLYPLLLLVGGLSLLVKRTWYSLLVSCTAFAIGLLAHGWALWPASPSAARMVSMAGLIAGIAAVLASALSLRR